MKSIKKIRPNFSTASDVEHKEGKEACSEPLTDYVCCKRDPQSV